MICECKHEKHTVRGYHVVGVESRTCAPVKISVAPWTIAVCGPCRAQQHGPEYGYERKANGT